MRLVKQCKRSDESITDSDTGEDRDSQKGCLPGWCVPNEYASCSGPYTVEDAENTRTADKKGT